MADTAKFTARSLEEMVRKHGPEWPADLRTKAHRALLTLKTLDQPSAAQSPAFMEASKADLAAFADAYDAWSKRG